MGLNVIGKTTPPVRAFDDVGAIRDRIYTGVKDAYSNYYPIENKQFRLELQDVDYDEDAPEGLDKQRKAIISSRTLHRPLSGTWRLIDRANDQVVDQRRARIAQVPHMTERGTFIYNGNEFTLAGQMRLKPGVFARRKSNGDLESHFNVAPGSGPSFRVFIDPKTGVFHVSVGQAKFPLYTLLRSLGIKDSQLADAWGKDLLATNSLQDNVRHLDKAHEKFTYRRAALATGEREPGDVVNRVQELKDVFARMRLDPDVTRETLGASHETVSPEVLLAATKKLIGISRNEVDTDDRDNIAYQKVFGPEDLFSERIVRDAGQTARSALWKATFRRSLNPIVNTDARTKQLRAVLLDSGLGSPIEETNPLDAFDQLQRISRMGFGGIPSTESIPDESRAVQPSYLAFIDPIRTVESRKAGVDNKVAYNTFKGDDGHLYSPMIDRDGNKRLLSSLAAVRSVISFPGERIKAVDEGRMARAMVRGRLKLVKPEDIDFELPSSEDMLSSVSNLVPLVSAIKGHRMLMAGKMFTQALALKEPEAPLVQSARVNPNDPEDSFEKYFGDKLGVIRSKVTGPATVTRVTPKFVEVKGRDGVARYELYNNFPFNRRSLLTSTSVVQPGQVVKSGDLLAHSNFTDKAGSMALGKNLRVGYLPYKGMTHEDAIVVSEGASNKLLSEHMYQNDVDIQKGERVSKNAFLAKFPAIYPHSILKNFDDSGVIKVGTVVQKDDPLILSLTKRTKKGQGVLRRSPRDLWTDTTHTWKRDTEGVVIDAYRGSRAINVVVKAYHPTEVGDKLALRYGSKGVISQIVPDDRMPRSADGKPLEVLMHPFGIISRSNPASLLEAALGKIAAKTGKPYKVSGFSDESLLDFVKRELKKNGMSDTEDVIDPDTNSKLPKVFVGNQWFMKLHHRSEDKLAARGDEGGYTADMIPGKAKGESSKRIGNLETNSLLSAGATAVLRDAKLIRGQRNDDFWRAFRLGYPAPTPEIPFVYHKFLADLQAAGVNVKKDGNYVHIMALTDKDTDKLSKGPITKAETLDFDTLDPIKGGLFDLSRTGGHGGLSWSHIPLHEPIPSPVMEEPIRRLLGLTEKKYREVLKGERSLEGVAGGLGIQLALKRINVKKSLEAQKQIIKSGAKSKRDDAVKRLRTLTMFNETGIKPSELVLTKIPVLPPQYRPISRMGNQITIVADPNHLYKEVMLANDNLRDVLSELGVASAGEERLALYDSYKALAGLGDPVQPKLQKQNVRGILSHALGLRSSPKFSDFQRRVLGTATDLVGRAVITPNASIDMDHVGMPEDKAWKLYRPFIMRNLVRRGVSATHAASMIVEQNSKAREVLVSEMEKRPVIVNRAPTLHRYGIMAAFPILVKGKTLQVPPIVTGGFSADFDGDYQHCILIVATCKPGKHTLTQEDVFGKPRSFWNDRRLVDYFDLQILYGDKFDFFCVDLEDFPRCEEMRCDKEHISYYLVPPGLFVVAYDEDKCLPILSEVVGWSEHRGLEVVTVDLKSGYQLLTDDDPRAVYGLDPVTYSFVRRRPSESVGMFVPRVINIEKIVEPSIAVLPISPKSFYERIPVKRDALLSREVGYLLGCLVGNGWVDISSANSVYRINLACSDDNVVARYVKSLNEVFVTAPSVYSAVRAAPANVNISFGAGRKFTFGSRVFATAVRDWLGHGARNKHLPPFFLSSPKEFRLGLVEGLWDTDGLISVSKGKKNPQLIVNYFTSSLRLAREIVVLLRSLGVNSRITTTKTPAGNSFWVLNVSNVEFCNLHSDIRHSGRRTALESFNSMPVTPVSIRHQLLPISVDLSRWLRDLIDYKASSSARVLYAALTRAIKTSFVYRKTALEALEFLSKRLDLTEFHPHWLLFSLMAECDEVVWDEVKRFTSTGIHETGYDLTVPGYETFMAVNGIITSNTQNFHVPVSDEAVTEAIEKLLPSRNITDVRNFDVHYVPNQEHLQGLFDATGGSSRREPRVFKTARDVERAYRRGEIRTNDRVKILEE